MGLKDLINKYKEEELIFIVGGGPSARFINIEKIKPYSTMAVNSGIILIPFANFFVSDDRGVATWSYFKNLSELNCLYLLYEDKLKNCVQHLNINKVIFYKHTWFYSPENNKYNFEGIKLNKTTKIIGSRTSMGSAVHLCYLMGYKRIILVGNDCQLDKNGKRYFWQYWAQNEQPYRLSGIPFSNRTQHIGFDKKSFEEYWKSFVKVNRKLLKTELKIIDCSDTDFDFFEKMSLEQILKKHGGINEP